MTRLRSTRLRQALSQLQLKWGDHIIAPAAEQIRMVAPTGFAALDHLLTGGLAIPSFAALRGTATSGVTTVALQVLARNQKEHDTFGAYIDPSHRFDPHLADQAGVDISRLLLSRPGSDHAIVTILRDLLKHGKAGVIIVEAGADALMLASEDARRLIDALRWSESIIITLNSSSNDSANSLLDVQLSFNRQSWIIREGLHVGLRTRVELVRKPLNQLQSVEFDIIYGDLA